MKESVFTTILSRIGTFFDISRKHAVAECIFFLFKIGESLLDPATRLYIFYSICEQSLNTTNCDDLDKDKDPELENTVQSLSATYLLAYRLVVSLPVIFIGLFCGAWSDKIGRKIPTLLAAFGTIFAVLFYMLSMIKDSSTGKPMLFLVLVGACIRGCFGKSAVITMALHSYISDITPTDNRTKRLGRLVSMNFFGCFVGSLLVGALLQVTGFDVIFCCVIGVNSICFIIIILLMDESVPPERSHSGIFPAQIDESLDHEKSDSDPFVDEASLKRKMKVPFRLKHIKESIEVLTKPRQHRMRLHLLILFFVIFFQQTCKAGEVDVALLFVQKSPLSWTKSMYGYLLATDYVCLGVASALILPLLIKYMELKDIILVQIGFGFKVLRLVLLAFSQHTWLVYFSVVLGSPSALIVSCVKSLISKYVEEEEIGKAFSLLSCCETLSNMVGAIAFTSVYMNTVRIYPGLTFLLDAFSHFLILLVLIILAWDMKNTFLEDLAEGGVSSPLTKTIESTFSIDYGSVADRKWTDIKIVESAATPESPAAGSTTELLNQDLETKNDDVTNKND